ncbi:hypothetical protein [Alkalitalea saponilacus]|uniref:Membrane protein YfhO n=1 Tax=Alkalitalea saponilacus TaxID=889453 RepID=A0A1T5E4P7_9BACT|nr:hypothetical protein [Alkalitalea saponilacus]ASB49108.1 hypothetical protein CDL62_08130 [Alkalitalea saponilacus]SKB78875.1 hypothetical protein SAMN03080601_01204 [Alkalitalea saponilacus]
MLERIKPLLPYLGIVAFFILITFAYFSPVLEGRGLPQMDNTKAIGMAKELVDHEKETGERSMWTNSLFSGMPAYQIRGDSSANLFSYVNRYSRLGLPYTTVAIVFLYLVGFFILMRSMGFNHWLSVIGSVAFAFGSYNFIIIIAGHITKAYVIALMAPVVAGILYTYNKNKWGGALFTTVALGANIAYNHVQITYYLALLVMVLVIDRLVRAIKQNDLREFMHRTGLLVIAAVLAVLPNMTNLWTTWEYGQESIRGRSLLAEEKTEQRQRGLDPDYAFAWSYGKAETLTLLIPNFMGGASEPIGLKPELLDGIEDRISEEMISRGYNLGEQHGQFVGQLANEVAQQSQYWGSKPFTSGPVYAGAIVFFLFILGLFIYRGKEKWWLLAGTILSILLAWGKNLEWFNMLMFNYFPLYNKFRTVEMALVIASLTIPVMAILTLREVFNNPQIIREKSNQFLAAFGLSGGVALFFYLFPGILSYMNEFEMSSLMSQQASNPDQAFIYDILMREMQNARMALLKADAFRSLVFVALASASLWFFSGNKISAKYVIPGILILILVDLWGVDKRYLNNDDFVPARQMRALYTPNEADRIILEDDDPHFRVFNLRNPFNEVHTSYFHKSIGGYHGAKLQRYQDVIDYHLGDYMRQLSMSVQQSRNTEFIRPLLSHMPVLNMLNAKYIVAHPEMAPVLNPYAKGNAWLVENIHTVGSTLEELQAIASVDLADNAVVHMDFADILEQKTIGSGGGHIELIKERLDYLQYLSNTDSPTFAVFSEIYYTGGWRAFINGEEVPIIRANYLLRGLFVPAGNNTIEFRFEPVSYRYGKLISYISSILILLLVGLFFWKRDKFRTPNQEIID